MVRLLADGDIGIAHGIYEGFGETPLIAFDIFRVADGKIVEHWDNLQPVAPPNPSGRSQTDGRSVTPSTSWEPISTATAISSTTPRSPTTSATSPLASRCWPMSGSTCVLPSGTVSMARAISSW